MLGFSNQRHSLSLGKKISLGNPFRLPTVPIKTGILCALEESDYKYSCLRLPGKREASLLALVNTRCSSLLLS